MIQESSPPFSGGTRLWGAEGSIVEFLLKPIQLLISAPSVLFLAALTAMLLRHPDVQFYQIDRVAFVLLVTGVVGRAVVLRQPLLLVERISWPMLGLTLLALLSVAGQPFDAEIWSLFASKLIVPFALFHLAAFVFAEETSFRRFETFALIVLAYLSFTAIAFLVGAHSLIFPRFILDENIGFHADRARGPLLQAVANGVSLNILGVLAWHAYKRGRTRGAVIIVLLASVPVAILATMTRAVWLSFAGTVVALIFLSDNARWRRRACFGLFGAVVLGCGVVVSSHDFAGSLNDRFQEQGPVDFRKAVYAGGWEMFLERPLTGWGFHQMPAELPRFVSGYDEKVLYPHNTYLELLVEHGVVGLALYLWMMWELWRLGRGMIPAGEREGFLNRDFHRTWLIVLAAYWVNAALVVMSYQFVNGLVFTLAGMLAAQRRRAEALAA
ncbi:MAG: O-antigen ligase family protein [Candidatus Sulfotelmatobacter sp.]